MARRAPDMNSLVSEGGVKVQFHNGQGNSFSMVVLESTPLRDVQKLLVNWLGLSFPVYSATLTKPDGTEFWDFKSEPFKGAMSGDSYMVQSAITDDMYFFDKMFRRTSGSSD